LSIAPVQAKPAAGSAGLFASPEKRTFVLSLLLVISTLAIYNQATHFAFVNFDDDDYITGNPYVQAGLTWDTVKWALTSTDEANWHPLTWISHALDCQWSRLNPAGHHLTNIVLHALNVVLLFLLLWCGTRRLGASVFVAMVFALHPVNVESVVWVSERKNVLSTMFFLMTLGTYGWYVQKVDWKRYLAVVALFVCALASKPMVVTLPFVLLLVDYWPLGRIRGWSEPGLLAVPQEGLGKLVLEKLPLLGLSAAVSLITMWAQSAAGAVGTLPFPLGVRLKNAIYCYVMYLGKAVWPTRLAPLYPHPGYSLALWKVALACLFLAAGSAVVWKFRRRGYLLAGWLWFLGTLVPVIGVVQVGNQAMADRYAYIPLVGIFVMVAWAATDLAEKHKLEVPWEIVPAACVLLALSLACYRQIGYWRNSLDLWTHTLAVTNNNFVAEDSIGVALVQLGRADEAYPHFVRSAELQPNDAVSHSNIGAYLHQHERQAEAVPQYEIAVRLATDTQVRATTYANLGSAYRDLGDYSKSQAAFEQALQLNPNQFNAWLGMGILARRQGKLDDAIFDFARSVELRPTAEGYLQLGAALAQAGHPREALAAYQRALQISPDLAEVQQAILSLGTAAR